jgi:hypothetical protein
VSPRTPQGSGANNEGVGSGLFALKGETRMLDEIRSFFREVGEEPAPTWPEGLSRIDPAERDLRAESELNWRLMMEGRYDLEFKIVDLYETRADVPAAIDLINEVIAIIRRNGEPRDARFREIWRLVQKSVAPISPP